MVKWNVLDTESIALLALGIRILAQGIFFYPFLPSENRDTLCS